MEDAKALDLIAEILKNHDAAFHSQIEQISLYVSSTGRAISKNQYTVTAIATYFVEAENATEALDIVYESMLGNDPEGILGNGEVYQTSMTVREGIHPTIRHGVSNAN